MLKNTCLFGLVDANNFYVFCDRVFNPTLENKPVVVLSNNDGCLIARSTEAKELGLQLGEGKCVSTQSVNMSKTSRR